MVKESAERTSQILKVEYGRQKQLVQNQLAEATLSADNRKYLQEDLHDIQNRIDGIDAFFKAKDDMLRSLTRQNGAPGDSTGVNLTK